MQAQRRWRAAFTQFKIAAVVVRVAWVVWVAVVTVAAAVSKHNNNSNMSKVKGVGAVNVENKRTYLQRKKAENKVDLLIMHVQTEQYVTVLYSG